MISLMVEEAVEDVITHREVIDSRKTVHSAVRWTRTYSFEATSSRDEAAIARKPP